MRRPLATLFALLLFAQPVLAGSQADPEIEDATGDVDVQHLVDANLLEDADPSPEELETSADVVRAWIDQETRESFAISVQLADVPEHRDVSSPLVEVWTHFEIRDGDYHAAAILSSPRAGSPTEASFELYEGEANQGDLMGGVDADADVVSFRVPKADVRDPGDGDELEGFYVTTHVPETQIALDYAPGADTQSLPALADAGETEPTDLDLSEDPTFGDRYAFQSFEQERSRISVSLTPPSIDVEAGEQASFAVRVDNDADAEDGVTLSTSNAPPGWSARVQPSSLTIPAQASQTATLYVTPADGADGHELVHVQASSDLGADKGATASIVALQPEEPSTSSGSSGQDGVGDGEDGASGADGDTSAGDGQAPASSGAEEGEELTPEEEADEVPLVSPLGLVVVVLGLSLLVRRDRN